MTFKNRKNPRDAKFDCSDELKTMLGNEYSPARMQSLLAAIRIDYEYLHGANAAQKQYHHLELISEILNACGVGSEAGPEHILFIIMGDLYIPTIGYFDNQLFVADEETIMNYATSKK